MKNNNTHILGMPRRGMGSSDPTNGYTDGQVNGGLGDGGSGSGSSSTNTGSSNKTSAGEWLSGIAGILNAITGGIFAANNSSNTTAIYDITNRPSLSTGAWIGIIGGIMAMMLIFVIALRK